MTRKARVLPALLLVCACACVAAVTVAWASQTATVHASFTPDKLGSPTNLSATATFATATGAPPPPITKLIAYVPAGVTIDTHGASTCVAQKLEELGAGGCPSSSRAGFGGGIALLELAKEVIREPFTVDIFLAPKEDGRLAFLAYVIAVTPASVELVLKARQIPAPKPYGFGFLVEVPLIPTLPGASNASVESTFLTFGSANVAYYETVHHKRTLVHLEGLIEPKSCPSGGFPLQATLDFADNSTLTAATTIPCPSG
jgi:hypothetical protein